jgi:hypothetical protein
MTTSRKRGDHFLGDKFSPREIEALLAEWVNVTTETDAAIARLVRHHPEVFSALPEGQSAAHWDIVARVQNFLRLAWDAPDLRSREWYIFKARMEWHQLTTFAPLWEKRILQGGTPVNQLTDQEFSLYIHPPPLTPFERVMWHFHRIAEKARHCAHPECPAPYFFAAKKGQKYCSLECSAPSQRDQKRRWWQENRAKGGETQ